jgi:hypothetical protein
MNKFAGRRTFSTSKLLSVDILNKDISKHVELLLQQNYYETLDGFM